MVVILHRYFFVIELFVIALISFFLAKGAGLILADGIEAHLHAAAESQDLPAAARALSPPPPDKPHYKRTVRGDAVLSRNLFDSLEGPISRNPEVEVPPPSPAEEDPELVRCTYPGMRLEATVAVDTDPAMSVASVSQNKKSDLYRIGDELGDAQVEMISWKYLILESEGDYCYMDLFDTAKILAKRRGPPKRKELRRGIHKESRGKRVIDRALVQRLIGNPKNLMRGIKVRPHRRGKHTGYLIRRIGRRHPAYLLGLKKNDLVTAVNGRPISNTASAFAALNDVRGSSQFKIDIVRKGVEKTLTVQVK